MQSRCTTLPSSPSPRLKSKDIDVVVEANNESVSKNTEEGVERPSKRGRCEPSGGGALPPGGDEQRRHVPCPRVAERVDELVQLPCGHYPVVDEHVALLAHAQGDEFVVELGGRARRQSFEQLEHDGEQFHQGGRQCVAQVTAQANDGPGEGVTSHVDVRNCGCDA